MASLLECQTEYDVSQRKRDNFDKDDFWITCDGFTVVIAEQRAGENTTQLIRIPKSTFDYFVRKYTEQQ
jgi:hypothetical protein